MGCARSDRLHTGGRDVKEAYDGEHTLSAEGVEKYLGQILSSNSCNIESLRNKLIGIQNKIIQILSAVNAGKSNFEMGLI